MRALNPFFVGIRRIGKKKYKKIPNNCGMLKGKKMGTTTTPFALLGAFAFFGQRSFA